MTKGANGERSIGYQTSVSVIQIQDQDNDIICYGLISTSEAGRTLGGDYPNTSIFCVQTKDDKKH